MILRVLAALVLVLGAGTLMLFLTLLGRGPFADPALRRMRALKDRTAEPPTATPVSLLWFRALPQDLPIARRAPLEARAVVLEGYVQRLASASDGDVHLEVADRLPPEGGATRYVTAEITPAFRRRHPGWRYERLAAVLRPNRGVATPWPGGPRRARITGWLLFDFHGRFKPSDKSFERWAPRVSGWEIHPVTRIEVWDEARPGWAEVGP